MTDLIQQQQKTIQWGLTSMQLFLFMYIYFIAKDVIPTSNSQVFSILVHHLVSN